MKTVEEIEQLEQSRFGQPHPRHGLKLLYWFSNECLSLDQNDVLQLSCDPINKDFGFHLFENRYERNSGKLLPNVAFPYYVVGNLSYPYASKLPGYVREDCTHSQDNSNMDRIIISLDNKWLHTVYVTQHSDQSSFNKHATYRISKNLILNIRDLTLEEFLSRTGYSKQKTNTSPVELSNRQPPCPAQMTTSICSPVQESKSPTIVMMNNTQGHHKAEPTPTCILALTSFTNQDVHKEIETPPVLTNNNTQEHHKDRPSRPASIPGIASSTKQDNCTKDESPPVLTNNNTQIHTTSAESQLNNFLQDNTIQTSIPQPPSKDVLTTSTSTPTIMSKNQNTDTESSPVSQMNSFFWGFYFLFHYFFFTFVWRDVTRIFIIVIFVSSSSSSSSSPRQNCNRGERGEKNEREGKNSKAETGERTITLMTTKGRRNVVTTCTPIVTSSRNQNTDVESSSSFVSQMNSFFWGFYFLFLFSFFHFFWGNVMRICITVFFFFFNHHYSRSERGKTSTDGESQETEEKNHAVNINN
ncbi:uncharacterized protein LOC128606110 [Ictalurus furcatus]|uniref:uncharacterized protein LOC128606110 n=1 Tax=Ictalurus furcatus TaxID=66913 RepID=UPI002350A0B2|nr:uncharacterized protein LOC128606110 [Ictalurus furcatus]